jgi:hypothetical protein
LSWATVHLLEGVDSVEVLTPENALNEAKPTLSLIVADVYTVNPFEDHIAHPSTVLQLTLIDEA